MNLLVNIKKLLINLYSSLKRFPYTIAFSTATTIMLIILVNYKSSFTTDTMDNLTKITMTTALGFPLFLFLSLLFERFDDLKRMTKIFILLGTVALLSLYYFYLLNELNPVASIRYIAVSLTLYLIALLIHYFYRREKFELYILHLVSRALITITYSVVIYIGLIATLFTLDKLLGLPVSPQLNTSTWFMVVGIFAPVFLLAGIPTYKQEFDVEDYPEFLKIMFLYIIMPLVSVYTVILYLYFIKILINWQLPQSLITHLVIWYSAISLAIIFSISPLSKKNKWVMTFNLYFPKVILPLLIMMFFAIGIRIYEYGITENRYYVILLGLWIFGIMLYYNLIDRKRNIILPLSLALLSFLSVFGPWSSFSISINSQNKRFEEILYRNKMIKNEQFIKNIGRINQNDKKEINAIITYFKNNHNLEELNYLPSNFTTEDMEKFFGFKYQSNRYNNRLISQNMNINKSPIIISNYDYYFEVPNYYHKENNEDFKIDQPIRIIYNRDNLTLKINYKERRLYQKSLYEDIITVYRKIKNKPKTEITPEDYAFIDENKDIRIKVIVKKLSGRIVDKDENNLDINSVNLIILVKLKDYTK